MPSSTRSPKKGLLFKLKSLFSEKPAPIEIGDVVRIKTAFHNAYPTISRRNILKVQLIENEQATITFMEANNIFTETIPLSALARINRIKN